MCGVAGARHRFLARVTGVQMPGHANKRATHLPEGRAKRRSTIWDVGSVHNGRNGSRKRGIGGQPPELWGLGMCGLA